MLRKLSLAALACTALSLVAFAPGATAADPQQVCVDNGNPDGLYPPSDPVPQNQGKFDLSFNPMTPGAITEVNGGATICGTDPDTGQFVTLGWIKYPADPGGPIVRCAVPNPPPACVGNPNSIAEGSYVGDAVADIWCAAPAICGSGQPFPDKAVDTYVRFNNPGDPLTDNSQCDQDLWPATLIACFQAEGAVLAADCNSDIVILRTATQYMMKINQPKCYLFGNQVAPIYFYGIDDLHICAYAGGVGGTECGSPGPLWLQTNPQVGSRTWQAFARWTDGPWADWSAATKTLQF